MRQLERPIEARKLQPSVHLAQVVVDDCAAVPKSLREDFLKHSHTEVTGWHLGVWCTRRHCHGTDGRSVCVLIGWVGLRLLDNSVHSDPNVTSIIVVYTSAIPVTALSLCWTVGTPKYYPLPVPIIEADRGMVSRLRFCYRVTTL